MRTPVIEALAMLAPNLVRVVAEIAEFGAKEQLEIQLQDALNAEFGNTEGTIEVLESIHNALKEVTKRIA